MHVMHPGCVHDPMSLVKSMLFVLLLGITTMAVDIRLLAMSGTMHPMAVSCHG